MTQADIDVEPDSVQIEVRGTLGCITLNRPRALNALSLTMLRSLTHALLAWQDDPAVQAVAIRGQGRAAEGAAAAPFGAFCAGGDIRFFYRAALSGDPTLEDFFTEEYTLNHLVHRFPKPCIAFMDGIVMGGGMGLCQGVDRTDPGQALRLRIVTERTRMAMPETAIGLFPDVGGGWFLARCPGALGEYLALTGITLGAGDACHAGLADVTLEAWRLPALWDALAHEGLTALSNLQAPKTGTEVAPLMQHRDAIDRYFSLGTVTDIVHALERDSSAWAADTAALLRRRSPLMLHVVLRQLRQARHLSLADELRIERGLVRQCFHLRPGASSETVEGIRALVIDKDQTPRWQPDRIEDVTPERVEGYFMPPWPAHAHPLRALR